MTPKSVLDHPTLPRLSSNSATYRSISLSFITSLANLDWASSIADAEVNLWLNFSWNWSHRTSSVRSAGFVRSWSLSSLIWRSIQAVTLGPFIFPKKKAIRLYRVLKAELLSFCIHQIWKSLINSLALSLSPSNFSGPEPLRALSVGGRTEAVGLGWLWKPRGRFRWTGGANTLACANWAKVTVGFTDGIPMFDSDADFLRVEVDAMVDF